MVVENDANAAAWGEFAFGAAADADDMMMVTVGTGVGGGLVLGGNLYRGGFGAAAEIGHLRVVPGGRLCGCGNHGCIEQYASGSALVKETRARRSPARGRDTSSRGPAATSWRIDGPMITAAAADGRRLRRSARSPRSGAGWARRSPRSPRCSTPASS